MPVFHTKTIESILEPVAQQVSRLVILHEEAEDGNAMPDLARPVQAVKLAVDNLVKVGYDTVNSSDDQILRQDMPLALRRVEDSCQLLLDASQLLHSDPYSAPARKKLIGGSRGILQGTSSLLLAFDESEVRKIIRICKGVLDYLAVSEAVDTMEHLVTFVKKLSPILTNMTRSVDAREKELTHQVHRELLQRSLADIKELTPALISSLKIFITTNVPGGRGAIEARENRDYVVGQICSDIHEIMRVLQLTTYDEDEWEEDDLAVMKKALAGIDGRMKQAVDWLNDPTALVGGVGEKSVRQIIDDARKVAARCANPDDRDALLKAAGDAEALLNGLAELRQNGQGESAQALALAKALSGKLGEIKDLTARALANTERSGMRRLAHTVAGKVAQADAWLADPAQNDHGLGAEALRQVTDECRELAKRVSPRDQGELVSLCDEVDQLSRRLQELCARGMGNTPEAREIARKLKEKLKQLQDAMQKALLQRVEQDFMDTTSPLRQLTEAAHAPVGTPNREANYAAKAEAFANHTARLADTARLVASAGKSTNKQTVQSINAAARLAEELAPQVIRAGGIVLQNPGNQAADDHFELLKKQYTTNLDKLRSLVDASVDTVGFLKATEEAILADTRCVETGIAHVDSGAVVQHTSNIARRANRVLQVAQQEADNSEDPEFVRKVHGSSDKLKQSIPAMVRDAKQVSQNPRDAHSADNWRQTNNQIIDTVRQVRDVFEPPVDQRLAQLNVGGEFPPPPDFLYGEGQPPPRPPPPETDDEEELPAQPQANQAIMMAAQGLHEEMRQWSSRDNELVAAAKRMALLMAKLSMLVRGEGGTKRDLIDTAKKLAQTSEEVTRLAGDLAAQCTDRRMRTNLLQVCDRIPTIGTQLKILSTVKATMLGAQESSSEEDIEATEMLVGNAQNLMQSVRETVRAAEAACVRIRVDSGYRIQWVRKTPFYQR